MERSTVERTQIYLQKMDGPEEQTDAPVQSYTIHLDHGKY